MMECEMCGMRGETRRVKVKSLSFMVGNQCVKLKNQQVILKASYIELWR